MTYLFGIVYFWLVLAISRLTFDFRYAILPMRLRVAGSSLTIKMKQEQTFDEKAINYIGDKGDRFIIRGANTVIDILIGYQDKTPIIDIYAYSDKKKYHYLVREDNDSTIIASK